MTTDNPFLSNHINGNLQLNTFLYGKKKFVKFSQLPCSSWFNLTSCVYPMIEITRNQSTSLIVLQLIKCFTQPRTTCKNILNDIVLNSLKTVLTLSNMSLIFGQTHIAFWQYTWNVKINSPTSNVMNELLVIGSLWYAQRVLGSLRGKQRKLFQRNIWRKVV